MKYNFYKGLNLLLVYLPGFLLITIILLYCNSDKIILPTFQPDTTKAHEPIDSIKIMTYNILNGAGVDPEFRPWAANQGYPGNRLPKVLHIIKKFDPDILGLQEAHGWDRGYPSVVDSISKILGMNFFLGLSEECSGHIALLTKFQIEWTIDYPSDQTVHALQAKLVGNNGLYIRVFIVHLTPGNQIPELVYISDNFKPSRDTLSIIMGDMNASTSIFLEYNPGWKLISPAFKYGVDHIWMSQIPNFEGQELSIFDYCTIDTVHFASDHWPEVSKINVYSEN